METGLSVPLPHASPSQKEQRLGQDLDSEGEEREPRPEAPPGGVAGGGVTPSQAGGDVVFWGRVLGTQDCWV